MKQSYLHNIRRLRKPKTHTVRQLQEILNSFRNKPTAQGLLDYIKYETTYQTTSSR